MKDTVITNSELTTHNSKIIFYSLYSKLFISSKNLFWNSVSKHKYAVNILKNININNFLRSHI